MADKKLEVPYLDGCESSSPASYEGYNAIGYVPGPTMVASGRVPQAQWTGSGAMALGGGESSAPLRVTHVGPCLLRGGAEFWLAGLARFLDPRRTRVDRCIITTPNQIDPDVASELGDMAIEVGGAEAVRKAAQESDVLICWGSPQLGRWLEDCRPKLCVFVAHGEGDWTRDILEACRPIVDHVVAVSARVREKVCDGFPCTTILNGIDSSRLASTRSRREVRETLGFAPDDFVLGYVGRFSKEKRVHVVLDAIAGLPSHYKALLVGWGALRNSFLDMANDRIPGRYAFVKASRYLGDFYHAMDTVCLTSQEEGFALVMLEAMMCGKPLIATPVGAVPEVVQDRINGLIIPGTADSLGRAATLLHRYPQWARGLAEEGQTFALEHGHARHMAAQYESLLHRLMSEKRAGEACEDEPAHENDDAFVSERVVRVNGNGHASVHHGNGNGNGNGSNGFSAPKGGRAHTLQH